MVLQWGIASAGKISSDFVNSLQCDDVKALHKVVAISARSIDSAKSFAAKFDIPKSYGSYAEMAKDPDVQVIQIK